MLPPILEIYVVWHPEDRAGRDAAEQFVRHFHGSTFSGLIGGAVEVFIRSEGWLAKDGAPRPIPLPNAPPPNGLAQADITAIVPVLGIELAATVEDESGPWHAFLRKIVEAQAAAPDRVGIFPLVIDRDAADRATALGRLFGRFQRIAASAAGAPAEPIDALRCRDLAQGIAQLAGGADGGRLTVFISHTKRASGKDEDGVLALIERVRALIGQTRLNEFFDANDLQPGADWDDALRGNAARSAMLALRTDLYASREWCQREMLTAKREGMPIVILEALGHGEERGSFLMDHVARVPVRRAGEQWRDEDIRRGLNLLVDECLKRALWARQQALARGRPEYDIAWWAPHAPEPATFAQWLAARRAAGIPADDKDLRVLHPDPPLGADERAVLEQMALLGGLTGRLDLMTPRMLAARGG